jgi:hypothetical protein
MTKANELTDQTTSDLSSKPKLTMKGEEGPRHVVLVIHHRSCGCHLPQRGIVPDATGKAWSEGNVAGLAATTKSAYARKVPLTRQNIGAHL